MESTALQSCVHLRHKAWRALPWRPSPSRARLPTFSPCSINVKKADCSWVREDIREGVNGRVGVRGERRGGGGGGGDGEGRCREGVAAAAVGGVGGGRYRSDLLEDSFISLTSVSPLWRSLRDSAIATSPTTTLMSGNEPRRKSFVSCYINVSVTGSSRSTVGPSFQGFSKLIGNGWRTLSASSSLSSFLSVVDVAAIGGLHVSSSSTGQGIGEGLAMATTRGDNAAGDGFGDWTAAARRTEDKEVLASSSSSSSVMSSILPRAGDAAARRGPVAAFVEGGHHEEIEMKEMAKVERTGTRAPSDGEEKGYYSVGKGVRETSSRVEDWEGDGCGGRVRRDKTSGEEEEGKEDCVGRHQGTEANAGGEEERNDSLSTGHQVVSNAGPGPDPGPRGARLEEDLPIVGGNVQPGQRSTYSDASGGSWLYWDRCETTHEEVAHLGPRGIVETEAKRQVEEEREEEEEEEEEVGYHGDDEDLCRGARGGREGTNGGGGQMVEVEEEDDVGLAFTKGKPLMSLAATRTGRRRSSSDDDDSDAAGGIVEKSVVSHLLLSPHRETVVLVSGQEEARLFSSSSDNSAAGTGLAKLTRGHLSSVREESKKRTGASSSWLPSLVSRLSLPTAMGSKEMKMNAESGGGGGRPAGGGGGRHNQQQGDRSKEQGLEELEDLLLDLDQRVDRERTKILAYLGDLGLSVPEMDRISSKFMRMHLDDDAVGAFEVLHGLGFDRRSIGRIVAKCPDIMSYAGIAGSHFRQVCAFMETLGLERKAVVKVVSRNPRLLLRDVSSHGKLHERVQYLCGLGIPRSRLGKLVMRYPPLLNYKVEYLEPTVEYLRSLGMTRVDIQRLVMKSPSIMGFNAEGNMRPRFEFLCSLGLSQETVCKMAIRFPPLLQLSVKGSILPKYRYLLDVMKRNVDEVAKHPQYFSYSLEKRIKPRYEFASSRGIRVSLNTMFACSDSVFYTKFTRPGVRVEDQEKVDEEEDNQYDSTTESEWGQSSGGGETEDGEEEDKEEYEEEEEEMENR